MIYKLTIPSVAPDVEEIRVLEWHGGPGRRFEIGELMVELETHKALVEVRAGQAGVLRQVLAEDGDWAQVGAPLALFADDEADALPDDPAAAGDLLVDFIVD
jgi:pyruvate/2-oxoglutarate dehydrogenase complex dihydrolipoamide acyltransferase (E2) component